MKTPHPIIVDRGAEKHKGVRAWNRFACRSRRSCRTSYCGRTAKAAYEWWTERTKPGARHKVEHGFAKALIEVEHADH